jgi:photosystem II stability/assembly factor-like uncharacterized protein
MANKCVMVYGSLFGADDFLIQDCGTTSLKWKWTGSLGYVHRMFFQNSMSGWFVVSGALLKVKGDGAGFDATVIRDDKAERINDVFFINEQLGWMCGAGGAIYKTVDAGVTWKRQVVPTDIELKEIKFLNSKEGWVSGSEYRNGRVGVTLVTRDGGDHWVSLNIEKNLDLSPIFFTDLKHGCGIDDNEAIVCTNDGNTWKAVYSDKGKRKVKSAIFFLNEKQGWVAGDCIWRTVDGGQTWEQQLVLPENDPLNFERVVFVNENLGWAQTLDSVWRTSDGGKTWLMVSNDWTKQLTKNKVLAK